MEGKDENGNNVEYEELALVDNVEVASKQQNKKKKLKVNKTSEVAPKKRAATGEGEEIAKKVAKKKLVAKQAPKILIMAPPAKSSISQESETSDEDVPMNC